MANIKVLYFGIYNPSYARNWVLINGLRKNGVTVLEYCESSKNKLKFLFLFFKYWKFVGKFDVMVVGFPGQEVMFLARLLVLLRLGSGRVKPIVFDVFTSHYGGYILDRKKSSQNSLRAKWYRFLDKCSCKLADVVLLDTNAHIDFFVKEYNLPKEKFRRIFIGANDDIFQPNHNRPNDDIFKVLFFGTYVPLQGAEHIVRAAKILENHKDIKFYFIGKGQDRQKNKDLAEQLRLKNINFQDMIEPVKLSQEISDSDVSLGIFGDTPKTSLVIPNKVYEALAVRKPVITGDTEAIRELFNKEDMMLVKTADAGAIAEAILKLKNEPDLREKLSENGYKKFINNASTQVLGKELKNIILNLLC